MIVRKILFAGLLSMLAFNFESVSMVNAAEKPGPSDEGADKQEFKETKSGLKYRIMRAAKGEKPGSDRDKVKVHYKGWLDSGKVFDSSYDRNEPIEFPLNRVIPGWTEGMQLVPKGGMIELEIPYELGYGVQGAPPDIPPKARLHFLVELLDITPGPRPVEPGKTDKNAPKEFTTTKSGLKYKILRASDGKKPAARNVVNVHYKGWLDNGKEFDSSYARGEAIEFPLNRVIKGWTEGLQLVGEGGMIELEIPSELGYGERGSPPNIPPKATLHFLVELFEVK